VASLGTIQNGKTARTSSLKARGGFELAFLFLKAGAARVAIPADRDQSRQKSLIRVKQYSLVKLSHRPGNLTLRSCSGLGVYFVKVLDRLGIVDQMKSKTVLVPGAEAGELVAKGEVEMGVAQASEIASVPGAQLVGPLPGDLNSTIVFAVGIGSASKEPAAAKSLIELLISPAGAAVLKSKGMDPA
jgi:Bacterial extracellular solute-binding protein